MVHTPNKIKYTKNVHFIVKVCVFDGSFWDPIYADMLVLKMNILLDFRDVGNCFFDYETRLDTEVVQSERNSRWKASEWISYYPEKMTWTPRIPHAWTESPVPNMNVSFRECKLQQPANFMIFLQFCMRISKKNPHNSGICAVGKLANFSNKTVGKCNKKGAVLMKRSKNLEIKRWFVSHLFWVLINTSMVEAWLKDPTSKGLTAWNGLQFLNLPRGEMDFKMFSKPCLFSFSQWYLHFQLLLCVILSKWIEFNEIIGKSFGFIIRWDDSNACHTLWDTRFVSLDEEAPPFSTIWICWEFSGELPKVVIWRPPLPPRAIFFWGGGRLVPSKKKKHIYWNILKTANWLGKWDHKICSQRK